MFDILSYQEASTISEAIALLNVQENAKIISGGTDVLIKCRERHHGYTQLHLVGVLKIKELKTIEIDASNSILIGAGCTFSEVENHPLTLKHLRPLTVAVGTVGGPQTRNAGTIGGNLCNGATSADSASTLFSYNAKLIIEGANGCKEVPIQEFYLGPGKVLLQKGEILKAIKILPEDYQGFQGHYIKFAQRNALDIANLGCSVLIKQAGSTMEELRISFGVAGPTPLRATIAEEYAKGKQLKEDVLEQIGVKCVESSKARDSWRASKAYREHLIQELPKRAIKVACKLGE